MLRIVGRCRSTRSPGVFPQPSGVGWSRRRYRRPRRGGGMADAGDAQSPWGHPLRVGVPPPVLGRSRVFHIWSWILGKLGGKIATKDKGLAVRRSGPELRRCTKSEVVSYRHTSPMPLPEAEA